MQLPVEVNGIVVAQAIVEEIDGDKAIVFIPATRFKMGVTYSLTALTPEVDRDLAHIPEDGGTSEAVEDVNASTNVDTENN